MDKGKVRRLEMRVSEEFLEKVEDWRRHQAKVPPVSEAIRTLTLRAIEADHPA